MTATAHALIGTVIAAKIGNPALAIPLAFTSHIILDLVPHWDAGTHGKNKKKDQLRFEAGVDVIVGFIASYVLIQLLFPTTSLVYAFIMIISAQGLDWLTAPFYMYGYKMQPFTLFHDISSITNTKLDKPWGIVTQAIVVGAIAYIGYIL